MTQPSGPDTVNWQNPAWTADTEALAICLWRLIQIYKNGKAPAIRPPSSRFQVRQSEVVARGASRE